jgi:UDP-glucose 4-epimerase
LNGKPFTVVGDGTQTRDFTYVTDVVSAFVSAADSDVSGEAINVGSGNTYSVNHLVSLLGGNKVHIPKRPGEPDCTFADTQKIRRLLGWTPKVTFERGVQSMIDIIEDWRSAPVWDPSTIDRATSTWFKLLGQNK